MRIRNFVFFLSTCICFSGFTSANGRIAPNSLSQKLLNGDYAISNGYQPNGVHAGIDFRGTGDGVTSVRSPIDGEVIANTSECGKVAIYDGRNTVILAHMSSRTEIGVSKRIRAGDYVGKASRVVGGGCTATAAHLHIEIRTGRNASMALPKNDNRNTTINPLTYFDGANQTTSVTAWEFNGSSREGWELFNFDAYSVRDGSLFIDPKGDDPYLVSPSLNLDANAFTQVKIRMASNGLDSRGAIYFKTRAENSFSENKKVDFEVRNCSLCGNAQFYNYTVRVANNQKWTGTITGIRLDPAGSGKSGTNTDSIGIDFVRITGN